MNCPINQGVGERCTYKYCSLADSGYHSEMRLLLLLALGLAGYVSCDVEDTPNVLPVEALVEPIQQIAGEEELGARMGLTRDFSLQVEMEMPVPLGMTRRKLRLLYKGVPVRVFTFQATCDPNGYYTGAVSGFVPRIDGLDVSVERKEKELRQVVVDYVNSNNVRVNVGDIKVKDLSNLTCTKVIHVDTKTGLSSVCYFCQSVIDTVYNYPRRPMVLIDALTLKVVIGSVRCRFDSESSEIDSDSQTPSTNKMCPQVQGGNKRNPTPVYGPGKSQVSRCRCTGGGGEWVGS
ncbi:uncharacterized protein LOC131937970 [Physella acuta]|uniref:uncharacterized protein LOC131937970 n=1 Tax=Physella acuta TaxID=109671 RepID=UPI0027DD8BF3|nr:uncharacterized protein LOC131937970 [Physella acuta]